MKHEDLRRHLDAIARRVRRARSLAVALDFDGTLAPIVPHPSASTIDPRARRALTALVRTPGVRAAILSGRRLADLRRQVHVRGLHLAGTAGLETLGARGAVRWHVPRGGGLPAGLREALATWCAGFPGAWLEDKHHALSLHFRAVADARRRAFTLGASRRLAIHADAVRFTRGRRVFEILPRGAGDKGTALERWLGPPRAGTLVFYFGDEANDAPALRRARSRRGVAVAVGGRVPGAQFTLPSPREVAETLEWLRLEWIGRGAPRPPAGPRRRSE